MPTASSELDSDSAVTVTGMCSDQPLEHELELMRRVRTQSRHHLRFVRFGLLQQGLHFAPTCGREADQALAFVMCSVATRDPPGVLHAAHQLGHGGLFGQHDAGEFVDAQTVFARQAGHDAPLHEAQAAGFDHGVEFA